MSQVQKKIALKKFLFAITHLKFKNGFILIWSNHLTKIFLKNSNYNFTSNRNFRKLSKTCSSIVLCRYVLFGTSSKQRPGLSQSKSLSSVKISQKKILRSNSIDNFYFNQTQLKCFSLVELSQHIFPRSNQSKLFSLVELNQNE